MSEKGKLLIWTDAEDDTKYALAKGLLGDGAHREIEMDPSTFADRLKTIIGAFNAALDRVPEATHGFEIETVEFKVGVNASGGVALVAKAQAGMDAAITITLKRPNSK